MKHGFRPRITPDVRIYPSPGDCFDERFEEDYSFNGDYEPYDDEWDEEETALEECGQVPQGGCLMAGTEFCDFDCPYRDILLFDDADEA